MMIDDVLTFLKKKQEECSKKSRSLFIAYNLDGCRDITIHQRADTFNYYAEKIRKIRLDVRDLFKNLEEVERDG